MDEISKTFVGLDVQGQHQHRRGEVWLPESGTEHISRIRTG